MTPKYAKVSEIADRFRVSTDAVYLWIRQGKIPAGCVARIAGTVRVDEEQFEHAFARARCASRADGSGPLFLGQNPATRWSPRYRSSSERILGRRPRMLLIRTEAAE